jgi:hypothetical protein
MRLLVGIIACMTFVISCQAAADTNDFTITEIKSGLWCPTIDVRDSERPGAICHETETIHVTGQSMCSLGDSDRARCTWYGFEFTYDGAEAGTQLDCVAEMERPTNFVSPNAPTRRAQSTLDFTLDLSEGSGRFTNPQFSLFATADKGEPQETRSKTTCFFNDEPVFSLRRVVIFPRTLVSNVQTGL